MKFFLISACMSLNLVLLAHDGSGQDINNTYITINTKNASIKHVLALIEKQTPFNFSYRSDDLKRTPGVTVNWPSVLLSNALPELLKNTELKFEVVNNNIILLKQKIAVSENTITNAADPVTGRVTDAQGKPLTNVSVKIKGGTKGTQTDEGGNFSIEADKNDVLVFSYVGYATQEISVNKNIINVSLALNVNSLDEVIVGGNVIPQTRKSDITAVTVINEETIRTSPYQTVDDMLRGLVPGTNVLDIGPRSVNNSQGVSIRGANGIFVLPVKVYLDGVEMAGGSSYLGSINKEEVERIEVVRGSAGTTLYGTNASNGIIMIFTKKGLQAKESNSITAEAGPIQSKWVDKTAWQQNYSINHVSSFNGNSFNIGATYKREGEYLPGGKEEDLGVNAGTSISFKNLTTTFSGRFAKLTASAPRTPQFDNDGDNFKSAGFQLPTNVDYKSNSATLSNNNTYKPFKWWTHQLILGVDLTDYENYDTKANGTDTAFSYQNFVNSTFNIRYTNAIEIGKEKDFKATFTSGVEYAHYQNRGLSFRTKNLVQIGDLPAGSGGISTKLNNSGIFAQLVPSYKDVIFLTGGVRFDKLNQTQNNKWIGSYRVGLTGVIKFNNNAIKPKVAYGTGLTPATIDAILGNVQGIFVILPNPDVKNQHQKGWDAGVETYWLNNKFSFEFDYYNQKLTDMLSPVVVGVVTDPVFQIQAQYLNFERARNKGVEFSFGANLKTFSVLATYSTVNSVIEKLGPDPRLASTGLKDGDRIAGVAKELAGLSITYRLPQITSGISKGSISLSGNYMNDLKQIDFYGYYLHAIGGKDDPRGDNFYAYYINYPAVLKINLSAEYNVSKEFSLIFQIRNLNNTYRFETNNIQPLQGRSWLIGAKFIF